MSGFLAPLPSLVDNPIINGDLNIWQRGTSFAAIATSSYFADRFQWLNTSSAVVTVSRNTSVPVGAGRLLNYSLDIEVTTADATMGASEYATITQKIEGYNFLPYAQRAFWLSFWVYATKTGIYSLAFRNAGGDRSFIAEYTVTQSNVWQRVVVPITASPSAGTWDYVNGIGLAINWCLATGSTFAAATGWQSGNYRGSTNQVNALDTIGNRFRVTGIRLDLVPALLQYDCTRTFGDEFALCQRYFEKGGFDSDVAPAAGVSSAAYVAATWAVNNASMLIPLQTRKRTAPTITLYGGASGGAGNLAGLLVSGSWANSATSVAERIEQTNFGVAVTYTGLTYGDAYLANLGWTASSEL